MNQDIYVLAYRGDRADGFIETIKISDDGQTITQVSKDVEHDKDQGTHSSLMKTGPNTVFLAYAGVGDDGYIKSFNIPDDGSTITQVISLKHDYHQAKWNDLFQTITHSFNSLFC